MNINRMYNKLLYLFPYFISFFSTCWFGMAVAQTADEEDLARAYGDKSYVTIATGSRVSLNRAPSIATVITAEDIKALGAIDLDEVLETVPGMHVSRSPLAYSPVYIIRGIRGPVTNPQVLTLLNGIPLTSVYFGDRGSVWTDLPLENVARIEVIRGPGSSLYGADAFSGVINIITKTANEIDGTQVGLRAGSFNTKEAWMLHGGKLGPVNVAGYLRVGKTDGSKETLEADAQTGWDSIFGTHASHAPGPVNRGRDAIDGSLDLSLDNWQLRLGFIQRSNIGSGVGVSQALDPTGENYSQRITSDLTYHDPNLVNNWDVTMQLSYMHYNERSDLVLFPPGVNFGGGTFADGMIGNPYKWERHGRFNLAAIYTGFEQHRVRLGAGYTMEDLYKIKETKNFNPNFTPIGTGSIGDVTEVTNTVPFIRPHKRFLRYVYTQDEWSFAKDWTLTAGIRHDQYSDFGNTTNPRLAVVWEAAYNLTAKLLYGTAFRTPSFAELYAVNNPVIIGNSNLKPEKMKTFEAAISWQPLHKLQIGVNAFHYRMNNIIRPVGTVYQNTGEQVGNGMELEAAWNISRNFRLSTNYSYQRSIDEATHQDAGLAPHHHLYVRSDWRFVPGWVSSTQINWIGDRAREPSDTRPPINNYTTVDLTVSTNRDQNKWDFSFSIRNLFNANAREPSQYTITSTQTFNSIPYDLPLPRRSFLFQLSYKL